MTEYLIVDGYNIIHAWPELQKIKDEYFADARNQLMEILADYQGVSGRTIIIVFDAHQVKGGLEHHEMYLGMEIVYTREFETADVYIERLVGVLVPTARVYVATSDWIEQSVSLQRGALRISARELWEEVRTVLARNREFARSGIWDFGNLHQQLPYQVKEVLERWRRGKS